MDVPKQDKKEGKEPQDWNDTFNTLNMVTSGFSFNSWWSHLSGNGGTGVKN